MHPMVVLAGIRLLAPTPRKNKIGGYYGTIEVSWSKDPAVEVYKNPTWEEMAKLIKTSFARGWVIGGDLYVWDGSKAQHKEVRNHFWPKLSPTTGSSVSIDFPYGFSKKEVEVRVISGEEKPVEAYFEKKKVKAKFLNAMGQERFNPTNPTIPAVELERRVEEDPRVLMNPNIDPQVLVNYAALYPFYVEQNPALVLLQLEDPPLAYELRGLCNEGWIDRVWPTLSHANQRMLAFAFAARVLPYFEKKWPNDRVPRTTLEMVARFMEGSITEKDLFAQYLKAKQVPDKMSPYGSYAAAYNAAEASAHAAACGYAQEMMFETAASARFAVLGTIPEEVEYAAKRREISNEVLEWQANQVRAMYERERINNRRSELYAKVQAELEANAKRHAKTKADALKAVEQAKAGTAKIAEIMATQDTTDWSTWIGLGLVGVGAVTVAILIGPELLLAAGIAEGASAVWSGAEAAAQVIATAEASGVSTVSVDAFLKGAEIAFQNDATAAAEVVDWLGEFAAKLAKAGIDVVEEEVVFVAVSAH